MFYNHFCLMNTNETPAHISNGRSENAHGYNSSCAQAILTDFSNYFGFNARIPINSVLHMDTRCKVFVNGTSWKATFGSCAVTISF